MSLADKENRRELKGKRMILVELEVPVRSRYVNLQQEFLKRRLELRKDI